MRTSRNDATGTAVPEPAIYELLISYRDYNFAPPEENALRLFALYSSLEKIINLMLLDGRQGNLTSKQAQWSANIGCPPSPVPPECLSILFLKKNIYDI